MQEADIVGSESLRITLIITLGRVLFTLIADTQCQPHLVNKTPLQDTQCQPHLVNKTPLQGRFLCKV